jgi:hypothetical protein
VCHCVCFWKNAITLIGAFLLDNTGSSDHHHLLDLDDFDYLHLPIAATDCAAATDNKLFLQILVQSKPSRFQERQMIRDTWGSVTEVAGKTIRLAFVMGRPLPPVPKAKSKSADKSE